MRATNKLHKTADSAAGAMKKESKTIGTERVFFMRAK